MNSNKRLFSAAVLGMIMLSGCSSVTPSDVALVTDEALSESIAEMTPSETESVTEEAPETAAETEKTQESESVTEDAPETESVTTSESEETIISDSEEASEVTSEEIKASDTEVWAHNFAAAVYAELENNKTAEDPTALVPISYQTEEEQGVFGTFNSDIFFLDVDFDGVPELFAGGHGMMGTGRYSVFAADGSCFGNDLFGFDPFLYKIHDNCMYASSGYNYTMGYVKLTQGLPSLFFNVKPDEKGDAIIVRSDGTRETLEQVSFDEFKALYPECFGVEYDDIENETRTADSEISFGGSLCVPDPENYTEEDIYNCLLPILEKYMSDANA